MKTNYYALALSLINGYLPEIALAKIEDTSYDAGDYAEEMKMFRGQGLYWKDIGELFGIQAGPACRIVKQKTS